SHAEQSSKYVCGAGKTRAGGEGIPWCVKDPAAEWRRELQPGIGADYERRTGRSDCAPAAGPANDTGGTLQSGPRIFARWACDGGFEDSYGNIGAKRLGRAAAHDSGRATSVGETVSGRWS